MAKQIVEILQEINDADDVLSELKKHVKSQPLKYILGWNFIPKGKFNLPEGNPPYKINENPLGLTQTTLLYEAKRMDRFIRLDIKPAKREMLFIQTLEALHASEAKILIAIKDQILESIFPNITLEKVVEAGYFGIPYFPEGWVNPMSKIKKIKKGKTK